MGQTDLSLTEFLDSQSNVVTLSSEKDIDKIDKTKKHAILLGADWCAYSQLGVTRFDKACNDKKDASCHLIDVGNEDGLKVIQKLGLQDKVNAFPSTLIWDVDAQEYQITAGMKHLPDMRDLLK